MIRGLRLEATPGDEGLRLDRFLLARLGGAPRAFVAEAIARGGVRVRGAAAAKGRRLAAGDVVEVDAWPEPADLGAQPDPRAALAVVFEDADLVVVDKPGGCPSHPLRPGETGTLANALAARFPETVGAGDAPLMAGLAHRLDAGTSGLLAAARTRAAFENLRRQFAGRRVAKGYLALARGGAAAAGCAEDWLSHDPALRGRMLVRPTAGASGAERALRAVTEYEPLGSAGGLALLRVRIRTGVTHQIRAQLAARGHAIVGDARYGPPAESPLPAGRHFLHAGHLAFGHPRTGEPLEFRCPLPDDLRRVLEGLDPALVERADAAWGGGTSGRPAA